MTFQQQTWAIFLGVAAILILTSVAGYVLKTRFAGARVKAVIDNLNSRIKAWWVMVLSIGAAFLLGRTAVIVLFAFASFFALREFITLTPTRRADHRTLFVCFFFVLPMQYVLVGMEWYGLFATFIPVYAFFFLPILTLFSADSENFLARSAQTQWGLMISVYCISHVPALLTLQIPGYDGRNALLMVFLILVVQSSDVLQYLWGELFGRHPISSKFAPGKSVEGFAGGIASATALGAFLSWMTPFSFWQAAGMALAITLMGFLGALVLAAVKRDRGVTEWGEVFEGYGGMLDRLDSVCFSAPVFYHLTRYLFAH